MVFFHVGELSSVITHILFNVYVYNSNTMKHCWLEHLNQMDDCCIFYKPKESRGVRHPKKRWSDQLYSTCLGLKRTIFGITLAEDDDEACLLYTSALDDKPTWKQLRRNVENLEWNSRKCGSYLKNTSIIRSIINCYILQTNLKALWVYGVQVWGC